MGTIFLVLFKTLSSMGVNVLEKWFPLQGERGHSSYCRSFQKQNREVGESDYKQRAYQFTQGYNILHRLQVHHLTLTFII